MALLTLYAFAAMTGQSQSPSQQIKEVEQSPLPIADYQAPEPSNLKELAVRRARNSRYNESRLNIRETAANVEPLPLNEHFWWGLSAIPVRQSDAVVIGEVTAAQAYLSTDKTGVYSEFTVQVEQVLKPLAGVSLSSIPVVRPGGAVRFPSGRLLRYETRHQGMPKTGSRYVLFLKCHSDGEDFSLLTGYEFKNNLVIPLDNIEGLFAEYKDWSEAVFLNVIMTTTESNKVKEVL